MKEDLSENHLLECPPSKKPPVRLRQVAGEGSRVCSPQYGLLAHRPGAGHKTYPWRTPQVAGCSSDRWDFIRTGQGPLWICGHPWLHVLRVPRMPFSVKRRCASARSAFKYKMVSQKTDRSPLQFGRTENCGRSCPLGEAEPLPQTDGLSPDSGIGLLAVSERRTG